MSTEQKEKEKFPKSGHKSSFKKSPTLIETTYEKVLSIINKVKEFIKKTSSETNKLISDLEWVIKVITNKSLYTYELKQEKASKQNSEYNKFINFVTKYNEEIIEMNKKHDIVSGILSIGKKGEMLLKPSLCLKKIFPDELKNMDEYRIEQKNIKKNNFIYVFGNTILNLYNQEMMKRKTSFEKSENSGNREKSNDKNMNDNNENKIIIKSNSKQDKIAIGKQENIKDNNEIVENYNNINKNKVLRGRQKSEDTLEKEKEKVNKIINIKKYNTSENHKEKLINENKVKENNILTEKNNNNVNIQTIKIVKNKEKLLDTKLKMKNYNSNNQKSFQAKNYTKSVTKLTKNEKITFNNIKKALRNYYIQFAYIENQIPNIPVNDLKDNFNNIKNIYNRTNYNPNNCNYIYNFNQNKNIDNDFIPFKNYKYSSFPHFPLNKTKRRFYKQKEDILKNYKIPKNVKENLILKSNEDKFENNAYKTSNNYKNNKLQITKRIQITAENTKNNLFKKEKEKNNNDNKEKPINKNNINQNHVKLNIIEEKKINHKIQISETDRVRRKESKKHINHFQENIYTLVDKYFEDVKMITDKDFHIFNFKKKVGHRNVLPIMGFVILKTLGLVDSKIISIKKLNSFLFSVSDSYKITTLYHNSLHGSDVTQSICLYFLNSNAEEICETTVLDLLGIVVSAMGHDLGHPGLNNNFLINSGNDLAINYNDASVLENYHTSFLFKILRKEENNILEKLSVQNYKTIRKRMISQILATDMANHGETISLIRTKIKAWQEVKQDESSDSNEEQEEIRFNLLSGNEKTKFDEQQSLLNYLIHVADLGHNCKRFEISLIWIELLCEEFWQQGDKEKALGIPVSFMCDRNNIDVPASQVGFLRGFILSSFDCLVAMFPKLKFTMENAEENIKRWKKMQDEKRLRGWTPEKEKEKNEEE